MHQTGTAFIWCGRARRASSSPSSSYLRREPRPHRFANTHSIRTYVSALCVWYAHKYIYGHIYRVLGTACAYRQNGEAFTIDRMVPSSSTAGGVCCAQVAFYRAASTRHTAVMCHSTAKNAQVLTSNFARILCARCQTLMVAPEVCVECTAARGISAAKAM